MAIQNEITLEEQALAVQKGDREQLSELLRRTDRWAWKTALRYTQTAQRYGGLDLDDLHQAALLGIWAAVDTFAPERGSFLHWSAYYMRKEIRDLLGIRSGKERTEYHCQSLDAPLSDDGGTLADLLPDPETAALPDMVATQDTLDCVRQAVRETGADLVEAVLFWGYTLAELAQARGVAWDALQRQYNRQMRQVRNTRAMRHLWMEYAVNQATPWYLHKGAQAAQWESSTERVAMIRERLRGGVSRDTIEPTAGGEG
jgi:RNA polymerase sigma factor (sigma-70 family)